MKLIAVASLGVMSLLVGADALAAAHATRISEPGSLSLILAALVGGVAAYRLRKRR